VTISSSIPSQRVRRLADDPSAAAVAIPLIVESPIATIGVQPATVGVPFPRGLLDRTSRLILLDSKGAAVPLQAKPSARWPDGSIQWALLDFPVAPTPAGEAEWRLTIGDEPARNEPPATGGIAIREAAEALIVDTGAARFHLNRRRLGPVNQVEIDGNRLLDEPLAAVALTDAKGRVRSPRVDRIEVEERGPVRATIRFEGALRGRGRPHRFEARVSLFAGAALVRVELAIHNPRRARHRGGLWDLGDPNSLLFRDLSLIVALRSAGPLEVRWTDEPDQPARWGSASAFEIHQESSGGDNWRSRNHINRHKDVPLRFRGYRTTADGLERRGDRASPIVELLSPSARVAAAVPEFWQQFPKAITVDDRTLRVHLFPQQSADLFELQGGERKTQTVWLDFGDGDSSASAIDSLTWTHRPSLVRCPPQWHVDAGAVPHLPPVSETAATPLDDYLATLLDGPNDLDARRELVDEYGWRHYGDLHADHEAAYYNGPKPIISHYNNQYDAILGLLTQYLRSGDSRWFLKADALARHVMDIDVYQTTEDKPAYNGGLFWHTDHYRDAATASHRTYSNANKRDARRDYGGGPGNEHNYATGLALFHHLTGSPRARETALGLADWVVAMDDGSATLFGLIDDGPTGLASQTAFSDFHGPGRGCGNSINALLDAWLLTDDRQYLDFAEGLIRRAVHPNMNIDELDLLNVEARWSYTVFLVVLARYLALKRDRGEFDFMFAHARACLAAFGAWMVENEQPYFDAPEKLEYPTETWAAQDLRKANAARLAAEWVDEPLRGRLAAWGESLSDRAWSDLLDFESRHVIRAMVLAMTEGTRDLRLRLVAPSPPPRDDGLDFGSPERFVPQKARVIQSLKSPSGLARGLSRLVMISRWRRCFARRRHPTPPPGATP